MDKVKITYRWTNRSKEYKREFKNIDDLESWLVSLVRKPAYFWVERRVIDNDGSPQWEPIVDILRLQRVLGSIQSQG